MQALEDAEEQALHMTSLDYCLPMITCEEPVDISFLDSELARNLSDVIGCSRVGEVRHLLDMRLNQCLMAGLCEDLSGGLASMGGLAEDDRGASIFDHDSQMGVIPEESGDHWIQDSSTASWTRYVVVPRMGYCHPSQGEGGPDLSVLSGTRITIPSSGKMVRDNWKNTGAGDGPMGGEPWTGKCVFYETWEDATKSEEAPLSCTIQLLQGFKIKWTEMRREP